MKKLGKDIQISGQSHAEIMAGLGHVVDYLVGQGETFLGRKLRPGHVLNGLILLLLDHDQADQLRFGIRALRRLEAWAMETKPKEIGLYPGTLDGLTGSFHPGGSPGVERPRNRQTKRKNQGSHSHD